MKRIFNYCATAILVFGYITFLFNLLLGVSNLQLNREMPLHAIQKIQEVNGKIYIGLRSYHRIQVYDLQGKYLYFIPVENHLKAFGFHMDAAENTHFYRENYFVQQSIHTPTTFQQADNSTYVIRSTFPIRIAKIRKNQSVDIILQPWIMSLVAGTLYPWLIGLSGVVCLFFVNSVTILQVFGTEKSRSEKLKLLRKSMFGKQMQ